MIQEKPPLPNSEKKSEKIEKIQISENGIGSKNTTSSDLVESDLNV